jgi:hypothetical protein
MYIDPLKLWHIYTRIYHVTLENTALFIPIAIGNLKPSQGVPKFRVSVEKNFTYVGHLILCGTWLMHMNMEGNGRAVVAPLPHSGSPGCKYRLREWTSQLMLFGCTLRP